MLPFHGLCALTISCHTINCLCGKRLLRVARSALGRKARKNLPQADRLIAILAEDRPTDLVESFEDARGLGARWRKRIDCGLKQTPKTAAVLKALD